MTVQLIWTPGGTVEVTGTGYAPDGALRDAEGGEPAPDANAGLRWSLLCGACCNDAALSRQGRPMGRCGRPTEGALVVVAAKAGIDRDAVAASMPRIGVIPFSSGTPVHGHAAPYGRRRFRRAGQGAVERILDRCTGQLGPDGHPQPLRHEQVLREAELLSSRGLRVLATAMRQTSDPEVFQSDSLGDLTLTGLQAMLDPPRGAAVSAVTACHRAGIAVKMITGDHAGPPPRSPPTSVCSTKPRRPAMACSPARRCRTRRPNLPDAVEHASVFRPGVPEQKLRLVKALQDRGHVVAMTGDGVNDAPALQQANIGVAMGAAAPKSPRTPDMVLTDDDFATIEAAVEEGRGVSTISPSSSPGRCPPTSARASDPGCHRSRRGAADPSHPDSVDQHDHRRCAGPDAGLRSPKRPTSWTGRRGIRPSRC